MKTMHRRQMMVFGLGATALIALGSSIAVMPAQAQDKSVTIGIQLPLTGADADSAIGQGLDAIEPLQPRDIDQTVGTGDAALHQIEKIGAAGEIGGAGYGGGRHGLTNRGRPDVIEGFHATSLRTVASSVFCASSTASVIPR